jgi:energy-coupling factor transport system permease protein
MIVTWKYRDRSTIWQRFDPRARLLFMLAMLLSIIYFWDVRVLLIFLALAVLQYGLARLTFRETRRAWLLMGPLIFVLTVVTMLTGKGGEGVYTGQHPLVTLPAFALPVIGQVRMVFSAEQVTFAVAQLVRLLAIALLAIVVPYTIDPSLYGVIFRGLGMPDKFAYAMDLAFRLVPTLGRDFAITYDAQRARGYELERLQGGVVQQIRRIAPLLVPVVIQAIVGGEETVDAMDLRSFGVRPRTWLTRLTYRRADYFLLAFSVLILAVSTVTTLLGYGRFWVPPQFPR